MPPGDRREDTGPTRTAATLTKRRDMWHGTVGALPDAPIHEPFPIETIGPEARHEALCRDLSITVTQTLAVRAVDKVAAEVEAALGPLVHARDAVEEFVRALEGADWLEVALHEHRHGILFFRGHGQTLHQHIAEASVVEFVFENLARLAGGDELADLVEVLVAAIRQGPRFPTEPDFHSVVLLVGKGHPDHRALGLGRNRDRAEIRRADAAGFAVEFVVHHEVLPMFRSGVPAKGLGRHLEIQGVVLRQRRDLGGDIGRTGPIAGGVGRLENFQIGRALRGGGVFRDFVGLCLPLRHLETHPAGEGRAKINLIPATTEVVHRHGGDFLADPVQRRLLGQYLAFRRFDLHRILPILVVEVRTAPVGDVGGWIHALAAEVVPLGSTSPRVGTRRGFPTRIGAQNPRLAVDFRLDLRAHMRQGGCHFMGCRIRPGRHPPPEPQPDGIATGL